MSSTTPPNIEPPSPPSRSPLLRERGRSPARPEAPPPQPPKVEEEEEDLFANWRPLSPRSIPQGPPPVSWEQTWRVNHGGSWCKGGGRQGWTQWDHQQWGASGSWNSASRQESWQSTGQARRSLSGGGSVTRRQAQAAKAKAGLPATITKDKLRQVLERWVNKQFRGPSSQGPARDPCPPPSDRGEERMT